MESMVVIDSTQDIWYTNYKSRTSWIAFNTSSQMASTSAICCLSSSAYPGTLSRLLRMALPSLTLVNSSCFFCLMASGIWARVDLWRSMAAFMFSSSLSSSARLTSSWDNSGSILREEFFKWSISCVSSLASCLLKFPLANKVSWSDRFLWACFTFRVWSSKIDKGDKSWGWITLNGQEDSIHWISVLDQIGYILLKHWQYVSVDFWSLLTKLP